MAGTALRVENLHKNFGGLQVLTDVTFGVEAGERVAVIGPNGAGKSTLLNVINGTISSSAGRVVLFGQDLTGCPPDRRVRAGLGRTFQVNHLFLELSVLENMLLALNALQPSRYQVFKPVKRYTQLRTRAEESLTPIALWDKRDEAAMFLSYGEQRQLEVAMGLASDPRLILLDEPTAGLSVGEVPMFLEAVKNMAEGTTVFLTSHDMDVVEGLADRVIVLNYGELIAEGTFAEIQGNRKVREIYLGVDHEESLAPPG